MKNMLLALLSCFGFNRSKKKEPTFDLTTDPNKIAFIFVGCSGSGKGTVSRFIQKCLPGGCLTMTTGDMCRKHPEHQFTAERGDLVGDEDILSEITRVLEQNPESKYCILDSPRKDEQVLLFVHLLTHYRFGKVVFIHIDTEIEECGKRLKKRALKEKRLDDARPEVIKKRLHNWLKHKKAIFETALRYCPVVNLNCNRQQYFIFKDVRRLIREDLKYLHVADQAWNLGYEEEVPETHPDQDPIARLVARNEPLHI